VATLAKMPELVEVATVAEWLGVSPNTVYRMLKTGMLHSVSMPTRPGGRPILRVARSSLERLVEDSDDDA